MNKSDPGTPHDACAWSNAKCIEIASQDHFPASVKELNVQKDIINRYLNYYLGGKLPNGLIVSDLTFAVISIMPLHERTEQFIWEAQHYKDEGTMFFLTPDQRSEAEKKDETADTKNNVENEANSTEEKDENEASEEENSVEGDRFGYQDTENVRQDNKESKPSCSSRSNENIHRAPRFSSNLKGYNRVPERVMAENSEGNRLINYEHLENSAFISSCNKLLNKWNTNQEGRIILKYFFGTVALILMRATTKKYKHLVNMFSSTKFLSIISFATAHLNYYVPHKRCLKTTKVFKKRNGKFPIMFCKIILNSFRIDAMRKTQPRGALPKFNIFRFTILAHTADYGFGVISMLQNLGIDLSINQIATATYCEKTAESWARIKRFTQKYMEGIIEKSTHHWARIINNDYFNDLSCKMNLELAVILAVFTEIITKKPDIWKSDWVKLVSKEDIDELKKLGRKMYVVYKKQKTNGIETSDFHEFGSMIQNFDEYGFNESEFDHFGMNESEFEFGFNE